MNYVLTATVYYTVINIIAFIAYGIDKSKAKKDKWRIPESTLIGMAVFGGGVGAFLGMKAFHHKTQKWKFKVLVPLFALLHIALIIYIAF